MTRIGNRAYGMLLAAVVASSTPSPAASEVASGERGGMGGAGPTRPASSPASPQTKVASRTKDLHETSASWKAHHGLYYQRNWGVDIVGVRRVASGYMLRFDYRVVDPEKASALTDKKARPYLIDEKTRTALAVPAMENIGELRQVAPLEHDRTYYVIFGNPGGLVKKGGRVTLTVGNFKAEGLVVD
jgi:hypothetical protein